MNLDVEYIDQAGVVHNQTHRMTRLAFAKHLAIAGQGYAPKPQKLIKTLAMFLHYSSYTQQKRDNFLISLEKPLQIFSQNA